MQHAFSIMLFSMLITVVTGFLISFLIQILSCAVRSRKDEPDEREFLALAVAAALKKRSES